MQDTTNREGETMGTRKTVAEAIMVAHIGGCGDRDGRTWVSAEWWRLSVRPSVRGAARRMGLATEPIRHGDGPGMVGLSMPQL